MSDQEDSSPHRQKLTVTIPRRRKSARSTATLRPASLHPSQLHSTTTTSSTSRPRRRSAPTRKKSGPTTGLSVVREDYGRRTDWQRSAFTELHGLIRCLFCAANPSPNAHTNTNTNMGLQPRGTINRLPDAAARHLRDSCAHFEGSEMYKKYQHRDGDGGGVGRTRGGRSRMSRKDIVAQVVREGEKIAVALVFCRRDRAHRKRCAELDMSSLDVEERLGRHAVLCKVEECECCLYPTFEEWLSEVSREEDVKMEEEEEERPKEGRKKKKRKLKHSVPGQLVRIKQEEEDLGIPDVPVQVSLNSGRSKSEKERNMKRKLKRKAPEYTEDELEEDEAEVAVLLEQIQV